MRSAATCIFSRPIKKGGCRTSTPAYSPWLPPLQYRPNTQPAITTGSKTNGRDVRRWVDHVVTIVQLLLLLLRLLQQKQVAQPREQNVASTRYNIISTTRTTQTPPSSPPPPWWMMLMRMTMNYESTMNRSDIVKRSNSYNCKRNAWKDSRFIAATKWKRKILQPQQQRRPKVIQTTTSNWHGACYIPSNSSKRNLVPVFYVMVFLYNPLHSCRVPIPFVNRAFINIPIIPGTVLVRIFFKCVVASAYIVSLLISILHSLFHSYQLLHVSSPHRHQHTSKKFPRVNYQFLWSNKIVNFGTSMRVRHKWRMDVLSFIYEWYRPKFLY